MELNCILMRSKTLNGGRGTKIFPKVANYDRTRADEFVEKVSQLCHVPRGQVLNVLSSVADVLTTEIGNGHTVTIQDLGTFGVSMKGDVLPDDNGVLQLRNARVAGVNFSPSKRLKTELSHTKFTLVSHNVKEIKQPTDEQLMDAARRATNEHGYIIRQGFAAAAGISTDTLRRWLAPYQSELEQLGYQSKMRVLPPNIVLFITEKLCIDV